MYGNSTNQTSRYRLYFVESKSNYSIEDVSEQESWLDDPNVSFHGSTSTWNVEFRSSLSSSPLSNVLSYDVVAYSWDLESNFAWTDGACKIPSYVAVIKNSCSNTRIITCPLKYDIYSICFNWIRCPNGTCVEDLSQCIDSTSSRCKDRYQCPSGECVDSPKLCQGEGCCLDESKRCWDCSCQTQDGRCPIQPGCPANKPLRYFKH